MLGYASAMNAIEQEMKSAGEEAWVYQTVLNALTNQYSDLSEEQKKNAETLETGKEALIAYLLAEAKLTDETPRSASDLEIFRRALNEVNTAGEAGRVVIDEYLESLMVGPVEEFSEATEAQAASLDDLKNTLGEAKKAIEDYNTALEGGEKGDVFKQYADIYQAFLERFQAGQFGAVDYQAAIDALLPDEVLNHLHYDYEEAGKLLASDFWQAVFADNGEDYGVNFISALSEIADSSGNIIDENGEVVASFKDLGDGVLDVAVDDFGKLAEALRNDRRPYSGRIRSGWDL